MAFNFDAEAIFFLVRWRTDDRQVCGPADIVNVISTGNRSRRESIYSIGIAPGLPDGPMEWFMRCWPSRTWVTIAASTNSTPRRKPFCKGPGPAVFQPALGCGITGRR